MGGFQGLIMVTVMNTVALVVGKVVGKSRKHVLSALLLQNVHGCKPSQCWSQGLEMASS